MARSAKHVIPKTIGACADKLFELKQKKSELTKQVEALDEHRKLIEDHIINTLDKHDARGVRGKVASVKVLLSRVPSVKDWPKFYAHILKTKDFSLLQKRVSDTAVKERWEAEEQVPGVEPFDIVKVSLTKN